MASKYTVQGIHGQDGRISMSNKILLEMKNITKSFPGVRALDGVSLSVKAGTVHALMGENGAGKSTLMKCLFGVYEKDSGQILLDGKEVNFKNSRDALEGGVAMVHQELNQAMRRSVSDNMWLGRYPRIAPWLPIVDERRARHLTDKIFERLSISVNPKAKVQDLSVSVRQMLEIAKAISYGAGVIVFDEPTAGLDPAGRDLVLSKIKEYRDLTDAIVFIVSHSMEDMAKTADRLLVMNGGDLFMLDKPDNVFKHSRVLEEIGLSVPQITRVFCRLHDSGIAVPDDVYTVESALNAILPLLKGGRLNG